MNNFDLKKFLIENKLTPSSLKEEQIQALDNIEHKKSGIKKVNFP